MSQSRTQQLSTWVGTQLNIAPPTLINVAGDASFRRYFRFRHQDLSLIAVDAPPATEKNHAFVNMCELLAANQLIAPSCHAVDYEQGFLIIEDLGDQLFSNQLNLDSAPQLYAAALQTLAKFQSIPTNTIDDIPHYDRELLQTELDLFDHWFVQQHLGLSLSQTEISLIVQVKSRLIASALAQPQCLVHRDFHSRNLMLTKTGKIALIDFQDAVLGPVSYDPVSLLKDCYIAWPRQQQLDWLKSFYQNSVIIKQYQISWPQLVKYFDWMGMQRHLKVLGIFSRLNYRDNKPNYLNDLPLTLNYLLETAAVYPEFEKFSLFLNQTIKPAMDQLK
ncbi:aminoglycoside phosphotransferase family protein [Aliikangiella sp. IMCC44653]